METQEHVEFQYVALHTCVTFNTRMVHVIILDRSSTQFKKRTTMLSSELGETSRGEV